MISDNTDNISHDNIVHNIDHNDDSTINNDYNYDSDFVVSGIPRELTINISQTSLNKDPYAKFKFPKSDPELNEAGKLEVSTLSSLEYLINLFCHRLDPGLKKIWDEMAGRDVTTSEISKAGMLMTVYDIRKQCSDFKKSQEKENYVKDLNAKLSHENLDVFTTELLKNVPKFQTPLKGLLFDFLSEHNTSQKILQTLEFLISEKQFEFLWDLFDQIQTHMIFKRYKKRVQKFVQLLKKGIIHKYKLNYYLRFISRAIMQSEKLGNIRIESLHSTAEDEFSQIRKE